MTTLRWESEPDDPRVHRAFSGQLQVGFVFVREDLSVVWQLTAVHTRYITEGGEDSSEDDARTMTPAQAQRELEASWNRWLKFAALQSIA